MPKKVAPYCVVVDSREQTAWTFPEGVNVITSALRSGDYSIQGYEDVIAIERKSINDAVQTVIHQRKRFTKELIRLQSYRFKIVALECSVSDILEKRYTSDAHPYSILGSIHSLETAYNVSFHFWDDRQCAQWMANKWLEWAWKRCVEEGGKDE